VAAVESLGAEIRIIHAVLGRVQQIEANVARRVEVAIPSQMTSAFNAVTAADASERFARAALYSILLPLVHAPAFVRNHFLAAP